MSFGIISKARFVLSTKTNLSLYYTLIYPYISYCNLVWSSTYVTSLNRIWLLQKQAVRVLILRTELILLLYSSSWKY